MGSDLTTNADAERDPNAIPGLSRPAFETLFRTYFIPLCAFAQYHFGFDTDNAKDIVQAGFLRLWETRHAIDPNSNVKAYLYKVVTNRCLDHRKHEKVKHRGEQHLLREQGQSPAIPPADPDFRELTRHIEQAIAELPEQMRRIFLLSRYEQRKYAEIAAELDISVKTVETQMGRALSKLRLSLAKYLVLLLVSFFLPKIQNDCKGKNSSSRIVYENDK